MPRIIDHDTRRAEILDGAFRAFDTHGYGALSMRLLAKELGTSTGTLYHYFEGKEAIFEGVVRRRAEADQAAARAAMPEDASAQERVLALSAWIMENTDRLVATLRMTLDFQRQGGSGPFIAESLEAYRGPLREAFGADLDGPALSFVLGMLVHRMLDSGRVDVDLHRLVFEGVQR